MFWQDLLINPFIKFDSLKLKVSGIEFLDENDLKPFFTMLLKNL